VSAAATVRPAEPRDLAGIWALIGGLAEYEKLERSGSAETLGKHLFGEAWPAIECLVGERDGALVGYALFYPTFSSFATRPTLWLEDLFVVTSERGTGLGHRLFASVARIAHARGCARYEWIVLDWNRPALEFYERRGGRRSEGWHWYGLAGAALSALAQAAD
jgi:GNAT superfamily N-acetyltransferase